MRRGCYKIRHRLDAFNKLLLTKVGPVLSTRVLGEGLEDLRRQQEEDETFALVRQVFRHIVGSRMRDEFGIDLS